MKRQRGSHRVLTCLGWPEYEFTFHEFLRHKQVAGGTVSQSKMGFGAHHTVHSMDAPDAGELAPLRIEFIDSAEHVEELLPSLYDIVTDGLIEVQDTTIVKSVRKGGAPEPRRPHHKVKGPAKLMRVFLGEADTWREEPLYEAIVKRLRMLDIAGATCTAAFSGMAPRDTSTRRALIGIRVSS
ncbi:MAG TPA: DUF190 domain-containing protein [Bryobacteraceae bacterium]|nr:DUF190 domain-containing protein [Bryobacteraceae bacterium]